jgi:hypothetical protein
MLNPASTIKTANGVDRRGAGSRERQPNLRSRIEQVIIICQGHRRLRDGGVVCTSSMLLDQATLRNILETISDVRFQ